MTLLNAFHSPGKIVYGWGTQNFLKTLSGKRVFVVSDQTVKNVGHLEKVLDLLKEAGVETSYFTDIEENPRLDAILKIKTALLDFKPDHIVGIGGGSPIDAAKCAWIFYEHPNLKLEDINKIEAVPKLREKSRFIAISTTSGSGTEVSDASVVVHNGIKHGIVSKEIIPDISIVDPEFAATMPPFTTANSGLDVMVHGLETYVTPLPNRFADPFAIKAIQLVFKYLRRAYAHSGDRQARENMHYAASYAGIAMTNTALGLIHGMADQIVVNWGFPHGRSNAMMSSYVIPFNFPAVPHRYGELASFLGVEGKSDREKTGSLIRMIDELKQDLDVPLSLCEAGIPENEFMDKLDQLVDNAFAHPCVPTNPRSAMKEDIRKIYLNAYKGEKLFC